MKLTSTSPGNGYKTIGSVDISSESEIVQKVILAKAASLSWKNTSLDERLKYFQKLIEVYKTHSDEVAILQSKEVGKPIKDSLAEVEFDLENISSKMKIAKKVLLPEIVDESDAQKNVVYLEPYGVAAVISPWNFPANNFFISILQLLIAGNTVVHKHSEECPLTSKLLDKIMTEAGFPIGVFATVYGDGKVGDFLTDQDIDYIHFTGSTKVGQHLYEKAASKFIPVTLEMGGSSPGIIFKGADLDKLSMHACIERFINCGQVCNALKRLIVEDSIFDDVVSRMKKDVESLVVGDPLDKKTDIGPLVAKRQLDLFISQVNDAVEKGARVITGGKVLKSFDGAYFSPTILTNVSSDMRVVTEEVFGPVLPIVKFKTEKEAIEIANNTEYGLSAYVYGPDVEKLKYVSSQLQAGQVSINGTSFFSEHSPFGGYKKSGLGRNDGKYGFYQVTQMKVVSEPIVK